MPTETSTLPTLYRDLVLDADALRAAREAGASDERIPMSLSSEYPVERGGFFDEPYLEVLDHAPDAVDLSRTDGGLPLLLDHDPRRQIGVVEDVRVEGGKLRGLARFSRSALGQEVRQDVLDGIRTRTSIGYRVAELAQERKATKDGPAVYRATKWALYENSIVSIPADPTVGVGRSTLSDAAGEAAHPVVIRHLDPAPAPQARSHTVSEQNTAVQSGAAPSVTVSADREAAQRAQQVIDMCTLAGFADRIASYLHSERSIDAIRTELMTAKKEREAAPAPAVAPVVPDYRDGQHTFSVLRAIQAAKGGNWSKAGYEREVSADLAKRKGIVLEDGATFLMPTVERLTDAQIAQRAVHVAGTANVGGDTVFTEYGGFIDLLRNRLAVAALGARVLPGLQGNVKFPRQTAAGTAYWVSENAGSDVTVSNTTFGSFTLSPKTLMAQQQYSGQLLAQSSINVDQYIRNDLAKIIALEVDRAALHGSGASGQPTGLWSITGIGSVAMGGAITYAKVVALEEAIETSNADVGEMAYLTTTGVKADAKTTQLFASTNGAPIWTGTAAAGEMNGYRAMASNQVSTALGAGGDHGIFFGVWSQMVLGEWGAVQITVDPYTLAGQDLTRVIPRYFADVNVEHTAAFAKGTGLTS